MMIAKVLKGNLRLRYECSSALDMNDRLHFAMGPAVIFYAFLQDVIILDKFPLDSVGPSSCK